MASLLYRLGRWSFRRWFVVIPAWILLLVLAGVGSQLFAGPTTSQFSIPGIPSERAQNLLSERFDSDSDSGDDLESPNFTMVIATKDGSELTTQDNQEKVASVIEAIRAIPDLESPESVGTGGVPASAIKDASKPGVADWLTAVTAQADGITDSAQEQGLSAEQAQKNAATISNLSPDKTVYKVQAHFDTDVIQSIADVTGEQREAIADAAKSGQDLGLDVQYKGQATQENPTPGGTAELIGATVALIVLAITFGSLISATLPLITGIVGVAIAVLSVTALSGVVDTNESTPLLATMLGLAVAIDYSLFITSRYKHEIRLTDSREHAAGRAVGTAGSAVVFAGLTVFIALSALSVVGIPFLTTMAFAAAGAVVVAVLIALTMLPALFGALKSKVFAVKIPLITAPDPEDDGVHTMGERWAKILRSSPAIALILGVATLVIVAIPVASLQLALPSDSTADPSTPQRKAIELIERGFGPGANGPLIAVIDAQAIPADARGDAFDNAADLFRGTEGVGNAQIIATNASEDGSDPGDTAKVLIAPETGPIDPETEELLHRLRDSEVAFTEVTGAEYGITGLTAIQADVSSQLSGALIPYLAIVVGLAFVLLTLVFRSLVVPLTAALGFLLSVAATFGATVAIFQWGWGGIVPAGPLVSFLPIFLIGVVFGLAMDYQVFLVTRMRESYIHGEESGHAVVHGFKYGARVVTAAAIIMISVFAAFMGEDDKFIRAMGFALAAAIVFDAFIVRMVIIPSMMYLLGDYAWKLPRWLDRILPRVDVEGENLSTEPPEGSSAQADKAPATAG